MPVLVPHLHKHDHFKESKIWTVERAFKWNLTQFLHKSKSVYPPEPRHLCTFITHSYSLSSWQATKCKRSTGTMLLPLAPTTTGKQAKTNVCMCAQEDVTQCAETDVWDTWHRDIPLKMFKLHNFLSPVWLVHTYWSHWLTVIEHTLSVKSLRKLWRQLGMWWRLYQLTSSR